jgi:hypothetical protein
MKPVSLPAAIGLVLIWVLPGNPNAHAGAAVADQMLIGQISDSLCKAKHEEAAEGQGKMADRECTLACVRGGSKYVLLVDGKVVQIANQTFADLEKHAGHKVKVTGDVKGDQITVSKIEIQE